MSPEKNIGGVTWHYRTDTNDLGIIDQVFTHNSCHLPEDLSGKLFLDIGAHIGGVSILAAHRGAKVLAYEPCWANYELLAKNLFDDPYAECFCLGIGEPGIRQLYLGGNNTGMNSAFLMFPELDKEIYEYMKVITLQEALDDRVCDFLKIDCEGCEVEILRQVLKMPEQVKQMQVDFHWPDRAIIEDLSALYTSEKISNDSYMFVARVS